MTDLTHTAEAMNLEPYWMPFTHNRYFKAKRPLDRLLVGAEGAYYTTSQGQKLFDGLSGLWCSGLGHGDPESCVGGEADPARAYLPSPRSPRALPAWLNRRRCRQSARQ